MMKDWSANPRFKLIKALVRELVQECGGVEAVSVVLGVSHQRVSLLQSPNHPDLPTLMHVEILEDWIGKSVLTGRMAARTAAEARQGDLARESREATYAAVDLQRAVDDGRADPCELKARAAKLQAELNDINAVLDAAGAD